MIKTDNGYAQLFKIYGKSEDEVKDKLGSLLDQNGEVSVSLKCLSKEIHIHVEATDTDEEAAKAKIKPVGKEIKKTLGVWIYSTKENETLEEAVVRLLMKHDLTVTTAESCTGGMIASKLVNVPGASDVFNEGFITYSNKAKRKLLDVSKNTLKKFGAVSAQTAKEMALGGVFAADADVCVAVTGVAGPDGGTDEKPVGLVYIACCFKHEVTVKECHFQGTRMEVREQSANAALDLVRSCVSENYR